MVVGDIVTVATGAKIPADGILIHGNDLKVRNSRNLTILWNCVWGPNCLEQEMTLSGLVGLFGRSAGYLEADLWASLCQVDESSLTGESDAIRKTHEKPFMLSGCTVPHCLLPHRHCVACA